MERRSSSAHGCVSVHDLGVETTDPPDQVGPAADKGERSTWPRERGMTADLRCVPFQPPRELAGVGEMPDSLRVAFLAGGLTRGGAEKQLVYMATALQE